MECNECKTCGAKDGRAGLLINDECLNCHYTQKTGNMVLHAWLSRTDEEVQKTFSILSSTTSVTNFEGKTCEEASPFSFATYIPCGAPATHLLHSEKDRRDYFMCEQCAWVNERRGMKVVAKKEAMA
jgi:hypothetical protein